MKRSVSILKKKNLVHTMCIAGYVFFPTGVSSTNHTSDRPFNMTHIVFKVWFTAIQQQHPASLVMTVLTAKVKGSKATSVLDVEVCL